MHQESQISIKKINPRSTGELNANTYSKHSNKISLEAEALELERCAQQALHTKHIFTAELVVFNKATNTLSTRRINGNELFHTLWNPTYLLGKIRGKKLQNPDLIFSRIVELGDWLSVYHQSSYQKDQNNEAAKWLQDSFLSKIKGIRDNKLLSNKKIKKIENRFLGEFDNLCRLEYLSQNHIKICRIHGDFIIYNILLDGKNNLHIIDFGDTRIAANIDDVARFYSNLWAIAHTNSWRKSQFLSVADNFLSAYALPKDITDSPYFRAMMAYNFLIHLYGQYCMRDLLSFMSNFELGQITKAGLKWIDKQIG